MSPVVVYVYISYGKDIYNTIACRYMVGSNVLALLNGTMNPCMHGSSHVQLHVLSMTKMSWETTLDS